MLFQTTTIFRKPVFILFTGALSLFLVACQESPPPPETETTEKVLTPDTSRHIATISTEKADELNESLQQTIELEEPPSFPGGTAALAIYLESNLEYPEKEKADGIMETIFVSFDVQTDGSLTNIINLNGENENLIAASIEVVENMPLWEPGIAKDGQPTTSSFAITVNWTPDKE